MLCKKTIRHYVAFIFLGLSSTALADVKLPGIFGDHMLLQRELATPIWGWAAPGEKVTVRIAGQEKKAEADQSGRWVVKLDPMNANKKGHALEVQGSNKVIFKDVLVGDVWICSGQSNMEWSVRNTKNAKQEIAAADYPAIRLFNVPGHTTARLGKTDLPGQWNVCSPQTVSGFSAVGYFFGRHIHQQGDVPVGLIGSNWGGTRIEPWVAPEGFRKISELKSIAEKVNRFDTKVPEGKATWEAYFDGVEKWVGQSRSSFRNGKAFSEPPRMPGFKGHGDPTAIYNAMIHPLVPYGVRGGIWYQGESNGGEGVEYFHKMRALIEGWREIWNQGDFEFYFYFVQLADFQHPNDNPAGGDGWARIREAQRQALTIPYTGMAVITDIGEAKDIHPRNKQDVGIRLAHWAVRDTLGKTDTVVSGPLFKSMKIEGAKIRLTFDHVGGGLMVGEKVGLKPTKEIKEGKLKRFAIAGKDKVWQWADTEFDGDNVIVSSEAIPEPVAVRYAYSMNPEGANLYNREGLPASPFRTDDW